MPILPLAASPRVAAALEVPAAIPSSVFWTLVVTAGALALGLGVRVISLLRSRSEACRDRLRSMGTWWALYLILVVAVVGGPGAMVLLLAVLSLAGLWEYWRLTREQVDAAWMLPVASTITVVHYGAIYWGREDLARVGSPLMALVVFSAAAVIAGRAKGFLRATALPLFGWMLIAYCPSHAALLASELPATDGGVFLYLVLVTELHDIAQALWGRTLGRHKITPTISPGKTWEGFLLGTATTVCLAMLLMPLVAAYTGQEPQATLWRDGVALVWAACGGLVIAVSGFLGDVCVSAVKRDCGVKDSGTLLPGHGGVLDRFDSLTLSAPAFYYYLLAIAMWTAG